MLNYNYNSAEGWRCPHCGAVMAPWQPSCINCTGKNQRPIEYQTDIPNITIKSDQITTAPNTITWASSLGNCITTDKTIDCTLTSNAATTAQNKLRATLKSAGIGI